MSVPFDYLFYPVYCEVMLKFHTKIKELFVTHDIIYIIEDGVPCSLISAHLQSRKIASGQQAECKCFWQFLQTLKYNIFLENLECHLLFG